MRNPVIPAIGLYSVLAFLIASLMAVIGVESLMGAASEGFSRACTNLALIGIAMGVWFKWR